MLPYISIFSRYLGELDDKQEEVYRQFREWIDENQLTENPWFNDTFYLRFCRARKFDLEKIKIMFQAYLDYRQEYQIDDIIERFKFDKRSEL